MEIVLMKPLPQYGLADESVEISTPWFWVS
jgi:hypothetical protein